MALIQCPECGQQISDKAPACPKCGCPVAAPAAPVASAETAAVMIQMPGKGLPANNIHYLLRMVDESGNEIWNGHCGEIVKINVSAPMKVQIWECRKKGVSSDWFTISAGEKYSCRFIEKISFPMPKVVGINVSPVDAIIDAVNG